MERSISGSEGLILRFKDIASHRRYVLRQWILNMQTYGDHRDQYGIYASNQDKYVRTIEELNDWDSTYMEKQYAKYLEMENIVNGQT